LSPYLSPSLDQNKIKIKRAAPIESALYSPIAIIASTPAKFQHGHFCTPVIRPAPVLVKRFTRHPCGLLQRIRSKRPESLSTKDQAVAPAKISNPVSMLVFVSGRSGARRMASIAF
jgi:hypothetical protein